jgi:hypothetical protein
MKFLIVVLWFLSWKQSVVASNEQYDSPPLHPPDSEEHKETSLLVNRFRKDPYEGEDKLALVRSGKFLLVHVEMSSDESVIGQFCEFNYELQRLDPSLAPRFIDLHQTSHCLEHLVSLPLYEVSKACREEDVREDSMTHSIPLQTFIFHQPKSGSSLLTNIISVSQPQSRVVSDSYAIGNILECHNAACTREGKIKALQEAVYLLGRTSEVQKSNQFLYIKVPSENIAGLPIVLEAFPDSSWLFVNRNAGVILQKFMNHKVHHRMCDVKKRRNPGTLLSDYLVTTGKHEMSSIGSAEQICAAYLASHMNLVAHLLSTQSFPPGLLVNYEHDLLTLDGIDRILKFLHIQPDWHQIEVQRKKKANDGFGHEWIGENDLSLSLQVQAATLEFFHEIDMASAS